MILSIQIESSSQYLLIRLAERSLQSIAGRPVPDGGLHACHPVIVFDGAEAGKEKRARRKAGGSDGVSSPSRHRSAWTLSVGTLERLYFSILFESGRLACA